jgi:hypothetical protein
MVLAQTHRGRTLDRKCRRAALIFVICFSRNQINSIGQPRSDQSARSGEDEAHLEIPETREQPNAARLINDAIALAL